MSFYKPYIYTRQIQMPFKKSTGCSSPYLGRASVPKWSQQRTAQNKIFLFYSPHFAKDGDGYSNDQGKLNQINALTLLLQLIKSCAGIQGFQNSIPQHHTQKLHTCWSFSTCCKQLLGTSKVVKKIIQLNFIGQVAISFLQLMITIIIFVIITSSTNLKIIHCLLPSSITMW